MQTVYVTVKVVLTDEADPEGVINDCDYHFTHDLILDTEIIEVSDQP